MKGNKSTKARWKTPPTSQEEAGVSTQAAKKRNTTIVTGKGTEKAKKKSATKEHGEDVIAATKNNNSNNNPLPLLNMMKLDEDDNYADNNNNDGPMISSVLPASVLPDALETAVNTTSSTQQVGGRIYSSTNEAWADACAAAAAAADIAYGVVQVQGSGFINSKDNEMLDEYKNDDDNEEDDDDDDTCNTAAATHNNVNTDIASGIALGSDLIYPKHHGLLDEDDDEEEGEEEEEESMAGEVASAMCSKPMPPNTCLQMSPTEAKAAMEQYRRDYKKIYNKQRLQSIKSASASDHSSSTLIWTM
jgi:hypothetical protein